MEIPHEHQRGVERADAVTGLAMQIAALRDAPTGVLVERYIDLFGCQPRFRHPKWCRVQMNRRVEQSIFALPITRRAEKAIDPTLCEPVVFEERRDRFSIDRNKDTRATIDAFHEKTTNQPMLITEPSGHHAAREE